MDSKTQSIISIQKDADYRITVSGSRVKIERGIVDLNHQRDFIVLASQDASVQAFPVYDEKRKRWNHAIIDRMCHNFYVVFVQRTTPIKNASPLAGELA
jgi:hypothetical protein